MKKIFKPIGTYFYNLGVSIDQFGNTIAGGNPDNTISARVGFFSNHANLKVIRGYWQVIEKIIDTTFYPIDGPGHCHLAYHRNAEHHYPSFVRKWMYFVISLIVVASCIVLFPIFWIFVAPFRKYPVPDKRLMIMKEGMEGILRKMAGIEHELHESGLYDDRLKQYGDTVISQAQHIRGLMNKDF